MKDEEKKQVEELVKKLTDTEMQLVENKSIMKAFIDLITMTKQVVDGKVHNEFMGQLMSTIGMLQNKESK